MYLVGSGWWFGTWNLCFHSVREFHHPNWRTRRFFRGQSHQAGFSMKHPFWDDPTIVFKWPNQLFTCTYYNIYIYIYIYTYYVCNIYLYIYSMFYIVTYYYCCCIQPTSVLASSAQLATLACWMWLCGRSLWTPWGREVEAARICPLVISHSYGEYLT